MFALSVERQPHSKMLICTAIFLNDYPNCITSVLGKVTLPALDYPDNNSEQSKRAPEDLHH